MKTYFLLFTLCSLSRLQAQVNVEQQGKCGKGHLCYTTIQAAINNAAPGTTITVYPGNYIENISISKSIILQSLKGPALTTITGIGPNKYMAPIMISGPVSHVTIGTGSGHGFTIKGTDNTAGVYESSCIQLGDEQYSPISDVNISYNIITPQGEAAILTHRNEKIYLTGLTISHNIFNGATFIGDIPAAGDLFSDRNTAKPAIAINKGAANTDINHNIITTATGAGTRGNYLIVTGSTDSRITMNELSGATGGIKGGIMIKGSGAVVRCNRIDLSKRDLETYSIFISSERPELYNTSVAAGENGFIPQAYSLGNAIVTKTNQFIAKPIYAQPECLATLSADNLYVAAGIVPSKENLAGRLIIISEPGFITARGLTANTGLQVYNSAGALFYHTVTTDHLLQISTSQWAPGIYMVNTTDAGKSITTKVAVR